MQAVLFAIISFIGWGTGDVFGTHAARRLGSYSNAFWTYLFGLIPALLLIPFFLSQITHLTFGILMLNGILAILLLLCWLAFNEAIRIGNPSLVGTIAGAYASMVVILSLIFFHEHITMPQVVAILITFLGFLLSSLNFSDLKKIHVHLTDKAILLAIFCFFGWGVYFTFIKLPIREIGWFWPNLISSAIGTGCFLLFGLSNIVMPRKSTRSGFLTSLISSLLTTSATFSFNFALSIGSSAIVAPIAGSYPALFALLSALVYKEPITHQQKLGILVTLLGIVTLSIASR